MSTRDQDVEAIGMIIEEVRAETAYDAAVFSVELKEQQGRHISGRLDLVTARTVEARPTMKMRHAGVSVRPGDNVALLVNPVPNRHICVMIRLLQADRPPRASGPRVGTHGRRL